jgi:hypothetical protein
VGRKPFQDPYYTVIDNSVLDLIMPALSANGWKVLCVAMRQTLGWQDKATATGRREWDQISYSQFMEKAGISSRTTVSRALQECMDAGYILRREVGTYQGTGKPIYMYGLNRGYEIPDLASPENGLAASPENGLAASPENGLTKTNKQRKKDGGDKPSPGETLTDTQRVALDALTGLGVEPGAAGRLAKKHNPATVGGWVAYAEQAQGLSNPAAFVVAKLRAGELPPPVVEDRDAADRRRYITGEFAEFVQH